jgi:hypothetical protein
MPTLAEKIAIIASGIFFMTGLLTGVWKYFAIMKSPNHQAPIYVDIAHRAALMYAFACLVLLEFIKWSTLSEIVESLATALPVLFFGIAIGTYVLLGFKDNTDNQFKEKKFHHHYWNVSFDCRRSRWFCCFIGECFGEFVVMVDRP